MDLSVFDLEGDAEKGATLTLRHPVSGDDLDVTISLKGADSSTFQDAVKALKGSDPLDRQVALLSAVTTGWDGVIWEGKALKFSRENAEMIYRKQPWVRSQVDMFISDRANFFSDGSGN